MDELILHYELHCKNCGAPMLLPAGMIELLFADPDAQPNHCPAIAALCRLCKSVATWDSLKIAAELKCRLSDVNKYW